MGILILIIILNTSITFPKPPNPPNNNIVIEKQEPIPKNCKIIAKQIPIYIYGLDGKWHFYPERKICIKFNT